MKKNRILILLLVLAVGAAMLLSGCSKSIEESPAPAAEETETAETGEPEETAEENSGTETAAQTLESYLEEHEDIKEQLVNASAGQENLEIWAEENTLIYCYDLGSQLQTDYDEAMAATLAQSLEESLKSTVNAFSNICSVLQDETGIEDIHTLVRYIWGDHIIYEEDFTADSAE